MAKLNGMYIFVKDETKSYGVDVTEHVVEEDVAISDHVKRRAMMISVNGELVGPDADTTLNQIKSMHQSGTLCTYVGRSSLSNCLITEFSTHHIHNIWGGCEFTMTLKEIRTASTSFKNPKKEEKNATKSGTQQVEKASKEEYVYHTVKKGDTIWDLVASSDAPYKKYGLSCDDVMSLNQGAFSRKGDFRTLQIGEKIIVGKR